MNPKKYTFGVSAGQFLGFLVHERGIEIGLKNQEAVKTMVPPTTKKELQQLISKINFVRRFISNLSRRIEPFMELVKIKANDEFRWGVELWQNGLNYSGSSVLVIARQATEAQRTSNGTIHWSVGSPPDSTTVTQDRRRFTTHEDESSLTTARNFYTTG
jgi:hypothetical protein